MNKKHTPGDWVVSPSGDVCCHDRGLIFAVRYLGSNADHETKANARLCAASPKLLALLMESHEALDVLTGDIEDLFPARAENASILAMRIRNAITEATGNQ